MPKGPNEQNQHLTELRQKVGIQLYDIVLLIGLPGLDGKQEIFVTQKEEVLEERYRVKITA